METQSRIGMVESGAGRNLRPRNICVWKCSGQRQKDICLDLPSAYTNAGPGRQEAFFLGNFFFRLRRRDSNNVEDPEILGGVLKPLLYEAERHLGLRETAVLWFASKCPMCS